MSKELLLVPSKEEFKTHKACGRSEEIPAVFDDGIWAITNHILDVVIETISSYEEEKK